MVATATPMPLTAFAPLTAHDRCDRCGARADVRMYYADTDFDLMFCGHHYNGFEREVGVADFTVVVDHRQKCA